MILMTREHEKIVDGNEEVETSSGSWIPVDLLVAYVR